jgi:hypothetical protein
MFVILCKEKGIYLASVAHNRNLLLLLLLKLLGGRVKDIDDLGEWSQLLWGETELWGNLHIFKCVDLVALPLGVLSVLLL